jgi:hypothetical protein
MNQTNPIGVDPIVPHALTEREKWERECGFRERELRLKESEQEIKVSELQLKRIEQANSGWRSPLVVTIMAATIAALGSAGVALTNGIFQRQLEDERAEQARILEMIKTGSADKAADNLAFLIGVGLISRKIQVEKLADFLSTRKPGEGPALPSADGTREIRDIGYRPADIMLGERAVRFQLREMNFDTNKHVEANPASFEINGKRVEYADENTYEEVLSVGPAPSTFRITGSSLVGDYVEVNITEYDYSREAIVEKKHKVSTKNGMATFNYRTQELNLAQIIKSKSPKPDSLRDDIKRSEGFPATQQK